MIDPLAVKAWNGFVMSSEPESYERGSIRRSAAIAKLYMGLANNGGINSFLTSTYDLDGSEVLQSLMAVGALKAAKQLDQILRGLGTTVPAASQDERFFLLEKRWSSDLNAFDGLSKEADAELVNVLERHVLEHEDFYLSLP